MPLKKGRKSISSNISELHKGPQFRRTAKKFGKAKANKQAVAIAMHEAGRSKDMTMGPITPKMKM